jgi:hypothetical protein
MRSWKLEKEIGQPMSSATITDRSLRRAKRPIDLTETLEKRLSHPATSPDFDLHAETNAVLKDIGLTTADAGGKLTFYGRDPILPSPIRFGTLAAVGLAARSVALAALWKEPPAKDRIFRWTCARHCGVSPDSLKANGKPSMAGRLTRRLCR